MQPDVSCTLQSRFIGSPVQVGKTSSALWRYCGGCTKTGDGPYSVDEIKDATHYRTKG